MYEDFFGLTEKPFSILPDPSFLYWGRTHRLAYAMLEYGVLNHAGISVVTGEVGCGKTTLVHRLLDQLSDTHTVALLSNIQEGRGDLLSWVLMGFGEPFADKSHVELFSQLQSFFIGEYAKGKRIVLIIDEAQNLSTSMLEELRMLSNINAGKDQLLQLILVGQPQLKDALNRPELLQLAQRIGSDFHLTPLNRAEVQAYIETRLAIAGCARKVFPEEAIDLIAEHSRGVPRVINIIADTALVYAFSAESLLVDADTIKNVVRDKIEFGVFGLASDEQTAPPLKHPPDAGIDAFASIPPEAPADDIPDAAPPTETKRAKRDQTGGDAPPTPKAPRPDAPRREPEKTPAAATKAALHDPYKASLATAVATAEVESRDICLDAALAREESSVTGVVVIAQGKHDASPESAIRSAGDGRAIVFACVGDNPEAVASARKAGAIVVDGAGLALNSAGRARNAGYRQLKKIAPHAQYVQFIDADYALDPDWIGTAERFLSRRLEVSVLEGSTITPKGAPVVAPTLSAQKQLSLDGEIQTIDRAATLVRAESFEAVGGFRGDLITAELEDLCVRLRRRGGRIWRLDRKMGVERPPPRSIAGWWSRCWRRGYDYAYCASLHGGPPERLRVFQLVRTVFWGLVFPASVLAGAGAGWFLAPRLAPSTPAWSVVSAILTFGAAVYGFKIVASLLVRNPFKPSSWARAFSSVLAPIPEFFGACALWMRGK